MKLQLRRLWVTPGVRVYTPRIRPPNFGKNIAAHYILSEWHPFRCDMTIPSSLVRLGVRSTGTCLNVHRRHAEGLLHIMHRIAYLVCMGLEGQRWSWSMRRTVQNRPSRGMCRFCTACKGSGHMGLLKFYYIYICQSFLYSLGTICDIWVLFGSPSLPCPPPILRYIVL